ncbi:hypothetical protein ATJ88_1558 [Isoptericola jiangsuensis]|uniref:Uncharacterized protein n=1 Tax=Isoptericola jiangsuensis TaxID=548579 RepID=A0A2A9EXD4_9MICO|nr:hypothetical protein [Isoptericola jiangsuensis]PFG42885.1 hypothetical protein ATJ88_1558 [Isoptericola jiangsuensis]
MTIMDADGRTRPATAPGAPGPARGWRAVSAVGVLMSAVVHLVLWFDGYRDITLVGPLFLLNALGGLVLTVLLLTWSHWLPLVGAIGFGAATLLAFVGSAAFGLLGISATLFGTNELVAAAAELAAVVGATAALLREQAR